MPIKLPEKLEKLFEEALYAVFLVNEKGTIEYSNKKYAELCNSTTDKIIGKNIEQVCRHKFAHVLETGDAELFQVLEINGKVLAVNKIPIKENGKVIGAVGLALCDNLSQFKGLLKRIEGLEKDVESYRAYLRGIYSSRYTIADILGDSEEIEIAKDRLIEASKYSFPVLLDGESGTGKELFAHALHNLSGRRDKNFVRINCAAIPKDLLESELFGYEPGAFSGAGKGGKPGKIELSDGGTLFLDEISDLPLEMQAKLLRVIQEKELERIGATQLNYVDFRLVSSSNKDLAGMVGEMSFRKDLYFRINGIHIHIPPLRERVRDILRLCQSILTKLSADQSVPPKALSESALKILMSYHWPGNVRELINVMYHAVTHSRCETINPQDLPSGLVKAPSNYPVPLDRSFFKNISMEAEKYALCYLLKEADYNISRAADTLGIHRTALYKKLKRHGLEMKGSHIIFRQLTKKNDKPGNANVAQERDLSWQQIGLLENLVQSFNWTVMKNGIFK